MYQISLHRRTDKQLAKLPSKDRNKILKKIYQLRKNPLNPSLNIKPFYNSQKSWRVRAGNLRAIYNFDKDKKIIHVEFLGYRGNIYKK